MIKVMRNILKFIIVGVFAILVSCELNETPEFSDSDAFVAFDNGSAGVNENGTTLSIPVTLASISGMTQAVTYTVIDGTAKEGVNFTLEDATKTLTFDAENRTQNIVINVINNPGVFTGDLSFQIQLSEDGKVKPSAQNICTVKIFDLDHPLAAILGDWDVSGESAFGGALAWTANIAKDPSDVTIVWFTNIVPGRNEIAIYGVVNEDMTEIKIPAGQEMSSSSYDLVAFYAYIGGDTEDFSEDGESITFTISADKTTIAGKDEFGAYVIDDGEGLGWFERVKVGAVFTR